ncbi:hypothetical protein D3C76_1221430 [compost metagenome]
MSVGLGMGSLLTVIIAEDFFKTTLLSMLAGGLTGTFIGWPKGLMAVIDGLLSGVMGGMMGTMLLVMIPPSSTHTMLNIISLFTIAILFLVFILLQEIVPSIQSRLDVYDDLFFSGCRFFYHVNSITFQTNKTLKPDRNGF